MLEPARKFRHADNLFATQAQPKAQPTNQRIKSNNNPFSRARVQPRSCITLRTRTISSSRHTNMSSHVIALRATSCRAADLAERLLRDDRWVMKDSVHQLHEWRSKHHVAQGYETDCAPLFTNILSTCGESPGICEAQQHMAQTSRSVMPALGFGGHSHK